VVAGLGLFSHGMKKGVEKKMDDFHHAVGKLNRAPKLDSPSRTEPVDGVVLASFPAPYLNK